jgi:succinyl-diaminopimelate desuccinylase
VILDLSATAGDLTAALVDVESVSGNEQPLADEIHAALAGLPHLAVHRDGNAVVARTALGRAQRVAIAGHIDTVPLAGNLPSRVSGGVLHGLGSCDMKGGVAVALRLAAHLTAPSRDVTYVFYDGEEVEAERNGLLRLSRSRPELLAADFAILMEPTDGQVEGGCQGTMRAQVRAAGLRAHSARSWMGRNAIHEAGAILDVLRAWVPRQPVVDGLEFHEGLNAVAVSGGVAGNVVPDECVVTVNYRYAPDKSPEEAEAYIRELFGVWEVTFLDNATGALPGLTSGPAADFVRAVGGTPRAKLGWTDVARFAELGIPAVNYGPGISEIAHTPGEYVDAAPIVAAEQALHRWLAG